jgi:hypothetical protein
VNNLKKVKITFVWGQIESPTSCSRLNWPIRTPVSLYATGGYVEWQANATGLNSESGILRKSLT